MQHTLLLCAVALCGITQALAPPKVALGDFVMQRAIQQQLYYSADLRNEPVLGWLAKFQGHEHLESKSRQKGAAGFPGTYCAEFGQLRTTPYTAYLTALGEAPDETIQVEVRKPKRRLSAREKSNPFLAAQAAETTIYDEPIEPRSILTRMLNTADALVESWSFHLEVVEEEDAKRVAMDREDTRGLPTFEMLRDAELAEGGETAYSAYTNDEPMPLYAFDRRAVDRLTTLRALGALVAEVTALTPEAALDAPYLRREAAADDEVVDERQGVTELVEKRRQRRREEREAKFVSGDELEKAAAAKAAALAFLDEFCATWIPRLAKGDDRSSLEKRARRPPPGMRESRPSDAGADAEVVLEALWAYRNDAPYGIRGGELVAPAQMGVRLREIRAAMATEARDELRDQIMPEFTKARFSYTSWTEEQAAEHEAYRKRRLDGEEEGGWDD